MDVTLKFWEVVFGLLTIAAFEKLFSLQLFFLLYEKTEKYPK